MAAKLLCVAMMASVAVLALSGGQPQFLADEEARQFVGGAAAGRCRYVRTDCPSTDPSTCGLDAQGLLCFECKLRVLDWSDCKPTNDPNKKCKPTITPDSPRCGNRKVGPPDIMNDCTGACTVVLSGGCGTQIPTISDYDDCAPVANERLHDVGKTAIAMSSE
jgi:hypothetical protein